MFFTAIALNYAKAFKVKNRVIDYLEDYEIISITNMTAQEYEAMEEFFEVNILGDLNYRVPSERMECNEMEKNGYIVDNDKINSTNFNGGITVLTSKNAGYKYLYNQVIDIVKENHVSATISNRGFDFSSVTEKIISELRNLGIIFTKK